MAPRSTFASLKVRNYRYFFWGQLVSITGSWLQSTAQAWLVLDRLDGGASGLGLLIGFTFLPVLLFGLWGGVLADRLNRRKILLAVQCWMATVALVQAVLVLTGVVQLWMVFLLAFAMGTGTAIEMPTRQAFVGELVGPELLPNAVALNSATFNGGRVFGPALGGLLVLVVGTGWCFAINAVSFSAVVIGLLAMRVSELRPVARPPRARGQIREGLRYAWAAPPLRSTLVLVAIVGTFTLNWTVVLPLLAKETFGGDAGLVGLFSAILGVGALVASFVVARATAPTRRRLVVAATGLGVAELLLALAPGLGFAVVALALTGFTFMAVMLTANSTLQLNSEPMRRGRVMALYTLLFAGSTPIGGPLVGWICEHLGPRWGVAIGGLAALAAALAVTAAYRSAERRCPAVDAPVAALAAS